MPWTLDPGAPAQEGDVAPKPASPPESGFKPPGVSAGGR